METLNISLPEGLKEFATIQVTEGGFHTVSEYLSELIRADQRRKAKAVLEAELLKGLNSGPFVPMTADDWNSIRQEVSQRHEARQNS